MLVVVVALPEYLIRTFAITFSPLLSMAVCTGALDCIRATTSVLTVAANWSGTYPGWRTPMVSDSPRTLAGKVR